MKKIEHIGIAVKNLNNANFLFKKLFGVDNYKEEVVESEGVSTSFYMIGETKVELLEATSESSPINKFINKRGEGVHHIAFEVENIESEIKRLKSEGFKLINDFPKDGADNKRIAFIHPKDTSGVLIELCEEK